MIKKNVCMKKEIGGLKVVTGKWMYVCDSNVNLSLIINAFKTFLASDMLRGLVKTSTFWEM